MLCMKRTARLAVSLHRASITLTPPSRQASSKMDYEDFLTDLSRRREQSVLRELTNMVHKAPKGTISFATGMPNPGTFPFQEISVTLKDGSNFRLVEEELDGALQYQPSLGYFPLTMLLQDIQDKVHGPLDWNKTGILLTTGSSEGLSKALSMLLSAGDPVIIQHPVYCGVDTTLKPYQPVYIQAEQDKDGIDPQLLRITLEDRKRRREKMPTVMYINPTGANPTGTVLTTERKKDLYKLAQEYNMMILEDDAYYYLHFLDADPVSMLSLDTDGRVLRMDSFSKILSSGLRLGFVTGPKKLIRQIELHIQASTLQTSSLTQVITHKLLQSWGYDLLQNHFSSVRSFYRERRDLMVGAAEKHLKGLAEWTVPKGGMFLWMKIIDVPDTRTMVLKHGIEKNIFLVPGSYFFADVNQPSSYVRASYSLASIEQIEEGMSRLASLIKEERKLNLDSSALRQKHGLHSAQG